MQSFDNATELDLKKKYSVVFIDAGTGAGPQVGYGKSCCKVDLPFGGPTCSPACGYVSVVEEEAKQLKAASPTTAVFIYTSAFCTSVMYNYYSRAIYDTQYQGFWLECVGFKEGECPVPSSNTAEGSSVRRWDFRNASARNYFAMEWSKHVAASPYLDGVYADSGDMMGCNPTPSLAGYNFTQSDKEQLFNATVQAWQELTVALNARSKYFTVSLKNMFNRVGPVSTALPPEGASCSGGLQGGRAHGGEDIIFGSHLYIPLYMYLNAS